MSNEFHYFNIFGFDSDKVNLRLSLFELSDKDHLTAAKLHDLVITPNLKKIIEIFYEYLFAHLEYRQYFSSTDSLEKLMKTQATYLNSLGIDFDKFAYFDLRLRIGVAHQRIAMPLSLYECAYQKLREIIFLHIPQDLPRELHTELSKFLLKIISFDMSITIDSYNRQVINGLQRSISHLEKKSDKFKELSHLDPLTGIANRGHLMQQLTHDIEKLTAKDKLCLIMLDIDCLGNINDKFGHLAGDFILKEITTRLTSVTQHTLLGRYGGDEFLMIAYDADLETAKQIMHNNRRLVEKKVIVLGDKQISIKISQGAITIAPQESLGSVIQRVGKELTSEKMQKQAKPQLPK